MPRGNPSPKLAITVDPDIHENILAAAARDRVSVSAWMTSAAREALQRRAGLAAVALWEKQHGRLTAEEMNEARRNVRAQYRESVHERRRLRRRRSRAADRNERPASAEHKARLELGVIPLVPAPVVAQVSRSPQQAQLRRFLTGCVVVPPGESEAHEAGRLLGLTRTTDVVDAV